MTKMTQNVAVLVLHEMHHLVVAYDKALTGLMKIKGMPDADKLSAIEYLMPAKYRLLADIERLSGELKEGAKQ